MDIVRNNVDERHHHVSELIFEALCRECEVDLKFTERFIRMFHPINRKFRHHFSIPDIPKTRNWLFKVWAWEFGSHKEFEDYYRNQEKIEVKEEGNSVMLKVSSLTVLDLVRQNLHLPSKDLALLVLDRIQKENSVKLKDTKRLEAEVESCTSVMQRNLADEDGNLEIFHFRILASEFVKEEQFDEMHAKEIQTGSAPPGPWLPPILPVNHRRELRGKGRLFLSATQVI